MEKKEKENAPKEAPEVVEAKKMIGAYEGAFFPNTTIHLVITKATPDSIEGASVVAGHFTPFKGTVKKENGLFTIVAKEPGNDPTDGKFEFTIAVAKQDSLKGKWTPDSLTKKLTAVDFVLVKKPFTYVKESGIYPFASSKEITSADVENLSEWETQVLKNEILARHGQIFTDVRLKEAFESKTWYVPVAADVQDSLTEVEKKNLSFLAEFK